METLGRLLLRVVLVPLGYAMAVVAGSLVVVVGSWGVGQSPDGAQVRDYATFASGFVQLLIATLLVMWLPNVIGILISEVLAVRSWIFHLCSGAVSAWVGWDRLGFLPEGEVSVDEDFIVIAAGLVWGLTYWAIAGWTAGFWKPAFRPKASSPPQIR